MTHNTIQMPATTIVIFVKRSPALVPNALCPPAPPSAPAKPPPLPFCSKTKMIKITAAAISENSSRNINHDIFSPLNVRLSSLTDTNASAWKG